MSGDRKKAPPGTHSPSSSDEDLPLAEPDAFQELGGAPAAQRFNHNGATEASEAPSIAVDLSKSALGDSMTEGQLVTAGSSGSAPGSRPVVNVRSYDHPSPPRRSDSSEVDPPESRLGTTLAGRYRLERLIAKGGMGRVYLATQLPLERQVAIKLLVNQRHDAEFRQRFFLEASTCARLVHRHIVTVHDYGEAENGEMFMAMEYLDGIPLSKVIQKQGRLPSDRACKIALQVCRALRTAHKTGVVHRDLKPGNVIVLTDEDQDGNDFIKVLDFGLVKAFEGDAKVGLDDLTKSGTWLGSPRYMAPEQIRCQAVDPRTDIYSLGVILFHMLAGRPPFVGANSMEVLEQHLRDKPPSIADVGGRSDYAPELEIIVERCLLKDANQRYQSMDELIGDLKAAYRLITGVSIHTESTLPTFAEIADPSLAFPPSGFRASSDIPVVTASGVIRSTPIESPGLERLDSMSHSSMSGLAGGRVTGTIRTPLEQLENSNPRGPSHQYRPDEQHDSLAANFTDDGSIVLRAPTVRWIGLVAALVVVMLAGFFSVKLFGPSGSSTVKVRITSKPKGAEVLLEGRRLGFTPMVYPMNDVAPGAVRTFVVRKPGHEDVALETKLEGEQIDLHAAMVVLSPPPKRKKSPESRRTKVEPAQDRRERTRATSAKRKRSRDRRERREAREPRERKADSRDSAITRDSRPSARRTTSSGSKAKSKKSETTDQNTAVDRTVVVDRIVEESEVPVVE